jgi:hypothetical protein
MVLKFAKSRQVGGRSLPRPSSPVTVAYFDDQDFIRLQFGDRNVMPEAKTEAIVQLLLEWEADGDAMRYVGQGGQICWRATPRFLDRLRDAELDAIEEFEDL